MLKSKINSLVSFISLNDLIFLINIYKSLPLFFFFLLNNPSPLFLFTALFSCYWVKAESHRVATESRCLFDSGLQIWLVYWVVSLSVGLISWFLFLCLLVTELILCIVLSRTSCWVCCLLCKSSHWVVDNRVAICWSPVVCPWTCVRFPSFSHPSGFVIRFVLNCICALFARVFVEFEYRVVESSFCVFDSVLRPSSSYWVCFSSSQVHWVD